MKVAATMPLVQARRTVGSHKWLMPIIAVAAAALIGWFVPTRDFLILPGDAIDASKLVSIHSGSSQPDAARQGGAPAGQLYMVTVYSAPANADAWLFGHVFPHARLAPATTQLPPNTSFDAFQRLEARMMTDSQTTAEVVALRQLGYTVTAHGKGVAVQRVEPGSPAALAGIQRGDVITALNGQPVETADQLVQRVQELKPGSRAMLTLAVHGGTEQRQAEARLGAHPENPTAGFLGINPVTYQPSYDFPVNVKIDSQGVIGPSAGLVLALQIMQELSPSDITHGKNVAATGTIDLTGHVGRIGDVGEKAAAVEGKASYFLVPKDDVQAAQKQAGRLKVVGVDSLQQALDFLQSLS